MTVRVDISAVLAAEARAKEELRSDAIARAMRGPVDAAAANERAQHQYQNRTGDLERGTRGQTMERSPSRVVVELTMDTEYAEYIRRMGLTEIDAQARIAEQAIVAALEAQAKRIAGG